MPHVLKGNWAWMVNHATQNPETKVWRCKETGATIMGIETQRLVHYFWMDADRGTPESVLHLYCAGCNPKPNLEPSKLVPASHLILATSFS